MYRSRVFNVYLPISLPYQGMEVIHQFEGGIIGEYGIIRATDSRYTLELSGRAK